MSSGDMQPIFAGSTGDAIYPLTCLHPILAGRRRRTEALEERQARQIATASVLADPPASPDASGDALHRTILLLAVMVDVALWYSVYRALISEKGEFLHKRLHGIADVRMICVHAHKNQCCKCHFPQSCQE